jgi:3-phosphoshikimate 1-carboxyvinyltransferase
VSIRVHPWFHFSMIDYTLPLDQLPDPLPIEPLRKPFDVTITPPGSKSITCRAYVLAALAQGESKIIRPLRADDPDHLLKALCTLGAEARWEKSDTHEGEDVYIKGVAGRFPRGGNLDMGDGGAPTRFMIAAACLAAEPVTIDASPRMRERPIAEGVEMLRQLGAKIEYVEEEDRLPVRVVPNENFLGGELQVGTTHSSQPISAILLIAPFLERGIRSSFTTDLTSKSYLDLTGQVLADWGLIVGSEFYRVWRERYGRGNAPLYVPQQRVCARSFPVESDASSIAYWALATVLIASNSSVHLPGFHWPSFQPDARLLHKFGGNGMSVAHERGDNVQLTGYGVIRGFEEDDATEFPDGAIALAVAGSVARHGPERNKITGLRTLRVKETDRIDALANELRKVGCTVTTGEDWMEITPPAKSSTSQSDAASDDRREEDGGNAKSQPASFSLASARSSDPASEKDPIIIETYNDHRMAMSFAILGLNPPNGQRLAIRNPKCVAKSYPTFWKDFAKLYGD